MDHNEDVVLRKSYSSINVLDDHEEIEVEKMEMEIVEHIFNEST